MFATVDFALSTQVLDGSVQPGDGLRLLLTQVTAGFEFTTQKAETDTPKHLVRGALTFL